jgi:hypothetical protein
MLLSSIDPSTDSISVSWYFWYLQPCCITRTLINSLHFHCLWTHSRIWVFTVASFSHGQTQKMSRHQEVHLSDIKTSPAKTMVSFRSIVVCLDDSIHSETALNWTLQNVIRPESDVLMLVHVSTLPSASISSVLGMSTWFCMVIQDPLVNEFV